MRHWTSLEPVVIVASLVFGYFSEYAVHRWLRHKKQSWAKRFDDWHSREQHHFFVNGLMT
jgi:hypothetical protein